MARYATTAEFDEHGLRAAAVGTVSSTSKEAALDAASALADSYLCGRFATPLSRWGLDLTQRVCQIAAYELVSSQVGFNPEAGHNMVLVDRKNDAMRWLELVAKGAVTPTNLPVTSGGQPPFSPVSVTSDPPRGW